MNSNERYIKSLQIKLLNVLKGSALSVISANDTMKSTQQRLDEMKAIEQFTKYIQDYQYNINLIDDKKLLDNISVNDNIELG